MHIQDVLPRDAIRGIDDPAVGHGYFGEPTDEVLVVDADPPRAYPVRVLSHHEVVNDRLDGEDGEANGTLTESDADGRPIAVTWCPICASGVVFDRRVDGRTLTFGTSGKLADDALVVYDRETESEWKQPLGRAIAGPLAGTDLDVLPASLVTWEQFRDEHPDGVVLQPVYGTAPDESVTEAYDTTGYDRYDAADGFGLREMRGEGPERTWEREDVDPKTPVLGVVRGDDARAYPRPVVERENGVVRDTLGDRSFVVVGDGERLHAFVDPEYDLHLESGELRGDGTTWSVTTGESRDGRRLERVPVRRLYAFAWQDDHGPDSFYGL